MTQAQVNAIEAQEKLVNETDNVREELDKLEKLYESCNHYRDGESAIVVYFFYKRCSICGKVLS